jgi:cell surface protein SprA
MGVSTASAQTMDSLPYNWQEGALWESPIDQEESPLFLSTPSLLQPTVTYDVSTEQYQIEQSVGGFQLKNPSYLTFKEYDDYQIKRGIREYWKEKTASKKLSSETATSGPLSIDIGGEALDKIFGNSTVDIRPQGSAELIFSLQRNKTSNPSLTVDRQKNTSFNFEQKIQMNVLGKIGDKLQLTTNYNTEATFDFDNKVKLEYTGYEDEIIKKIEIGNVGLPLNGTLITGSQSLLGVKTELQFGRARVTTIFSQQKSKAKVIDVAGGAQTTDFDVYADQYEESKHFFLAHHFKEQYDNALSQLPFINSAVNITKVEVWVSNKTGTTNNTRNILAFLDLGELGPNMSQPLLFPEDIPGVYPDNSRNTLYATMLNEGDDLRNINQVSSIFGSSAYSDFQGAQDYEKLERARLLDASEYSLHSQLGYISLNSKLGPDEVLAVAYEYTVGNNTYQVGEFTSDGPTAPSSLYVKLLKNTNFSPSVPNWDLMMKNIYSLGAYNLSSQEFFLDVVYENTEDNGTITNYIGEGAVKGIPIIKLVGLDQLNSQQERRSDGIFDFIQGTTILTNNGRVIFPVREPFGDYLRSQFENSDLADKYAYDVLYDSTLTVAQQFPELNKFRLKGSYQSESGSEIYLGVLSVEEGSVIVTAGGVKLEEGSDYTVNYGMGKVTIINEGILMSGTPIRISVESNTFGLQQRSLIGTHVDYRISEDFSLGGTILNLTERPYTKKVNSGEEPISNTIWGLDGTYRTESAFLTKAVDALPFLETKEKSTVTAVAEFAQLIPGHQRSIGKEGTAYIDDFEASSTGIDIRNSGAWFHSSLPSDPILFPESTLEGQGAKSGNLGTGMNRALLSWYTIDPTFYRGNVTTPDHIQNDQAQLSNHSVREVLEKEVFPNKDPEIGSQISNLPVLDIAYYPSERGPYNYDVQGLNPDGSLQNPSQRWAGMSRKLESTDFEAQNIEFIEFWMMDPFHDDSENQSGGVMYLNIGNVSEDVLKDGYKSYENGLPPSAVLENVDDESSVWGRMPTTFALTNTFDNAAESRAFQDVGLDGLRDIDERSFFDTTYVQKVADEFGTTSQAYVNANNDPSGDNYHYFLGDDYDAAEVSILGRYKRRNSPDGNSALPDPTPTMATSVPNTEDINFDNTLNESESYFQYEVPLYPDEMEVGRNYIVDKQESVAKTPAGDRAITWYQFKVPVHQPDKIVGSIRDFKSIRFMRVFLKDFEQPVVLRMATLELVRGEWRRYNFDLRAEGEYVPNDDDEQTTFDVSVVNIEENGERWPVPYVLPPGIEQEQDNTTTYIRKQNEQSLVLKTCNLQDGDSRASYKTFSNDFRTYKRLKMFVHAEASGEDENAIKDGDLSVFIRLGTDFNNNYYEYEIPLKLTPWGATKLEDAVIWPSANELDISFESLLAVKQERNKMLRQGLHESVREAFTRTDGQNKITVVGNPNVSQVKTIMLGVRNPKKGADANSPYADDGLSKCAEVWLNELRLSDFDEEGGVAANARVNARLADFANLNLSGSMSTIGFGGIEQTVTGRQKFDAYQYDLSSTFALGEFFPEKMNLKVPMYIGVSEAIQTPQYNPLDPDITLKSSLDELETKAERDSLREITQDYTQRKSINFSNVRMSPAGDAKKKKLYSPENFSATYSYNETTSHNVNVKERTTTNTKAMLNYNYSAKPKNIKPFAKVKLFRNKYFRLLKDFNFYTLPKSISFQTDLDRYFNKTQLRNINASTFEIEPSYSKSFNWNRNYSIKYDLSRTLKTEFKVRNTASIDEPYGAIDKLDPLYEEKRDTVWQNIRNFGRPTLYHHTVNVSYNVPINKFPLTDWVTLNTKYTANYDWLAAPVSLQRLGSTIQNSQNKQINGNVNFTQLYNKVPYLKKINQKGNRGRRANRGGPRGGGRMESIVLPADQDTVKKTFKDYLEYAVRFGMMLKNASFTYSRNQSTILPGYTPKPHFFGQDWSMMAPGIPFAVGAQNINIQELANSGGWLTADTSLNQFYKYNNSENLSLRSSLEPFKGFRIDVTASRMNTTGKQEIYRADKWGVYSPYNTIENGSYSVSFLSMNTAFIADDELHSSANFQQFRDNRIIIANRLAELNPADNPINDTTGFPLGYQSTSQEVLIASFMAAYSGKDAQTMDMNKFPSIPMPNWRITFDGLRNIKWIRKHTKTVTLSHGYRSTYSVGAYTSNLDYEGGDWPSEVNKVTQNYYDKYEINQVSIIEAFSPLLKLDATLQNSLMARLEIKKDRRLSLGLSNNQLTETSSSEWVIGSGYRLKNVSFNMRAAGRQRKITSDLDIKLDFSIRTNKAVIRKLEENTEEITSGNKVISMKLTADYVVNSRLNVRAFFDKVLTDPMIATSFPTAVTNGGFSIRFTLAQ